MAKYRVTHTCGHEGVVNLIGHHSYRERRLASLGQEECWDCYKQHSTEVAHEQAEVLELPALIGTEKQIAWAETLRMTKLAEINEWIERADPPSEDDEKEQQIAARALAAVERITSETFAKQWIEWRDSLPRDIIRRTMAIMIKEPTPAQKETAALERKKQEAARIAAEAEATLRPETAISEIVAEIVVVEQVISIHFPENRDDFNQILRDRGYVWLDHRWKRTIHTLFAGSVQDRVVEVCQAILHQGFLVRIFDDDLRDKVIAGTFEPEHTRWISKNAVDGPYFGWFRIKWGRGEDWYQAARKIEQSKYHRPHVVVPPQQFAQVLDFAQMYDFRLSPGAQEVIDQAKEARTQMLVVATKPTKQQEQRPSANGKPPKLEAESTDIHAELRDD